MTTHFGAICDECKVIQTFTSAEARDEWKANHHNEDDE